MHTTLTSSPKKRKLHSHLINSHQCSRQNTKKIATLSKKISKHGVNVVGEGKALKIQ